MFCLRLHLRATDYAHSQIDSQICHKLVTGLIERSNAKPLVTILFFNVFNKTSNFAVLTSTF